MLGVGALVGWVVLLLLVVAGVYQLWGMLGYAGLAVSRVSWTWEGLCCEKGWRGRVDGHLAVLVPCRGDGHVLSRGVPLVVQQAEALGRTAVRVFVVCDGGRLEDVEAARACGASPFCVDSGGRGKQEALRQAWQRLGRVGRWCGVLVMDADGVPGPGLVAEALEFCRAGGRYGQAVLESVEPRGWVGRAIASGYAVSDYAWQGLRSRWGASVLGGTGMVLGRAVLFDGGGTFPAWPRTGLADDLELTCRAVLQGTRAWLLRSYVLDEKPETLSGALWQRVRWMRGHLACLRRYGWSLLFRGGRGLDVAAYLVSPVVMAVFWVVFWVVVVLHPVSVWVSFGVGYVMNVCALAAVEANDVGLSGGDLARRARQRRRAGLASLLLSGAEMLCFNLLVPPLAVVLAVILRSRGGWRVTAKRAA